MSDIQINLGTVLEIMLDLLILIKVVNIISMLTNFFIDLFVIKEFIVTCPIWQLLFLLLPTKVDFGYFSFLNADFFTKLFNVLVCRVEDLHESFVLLEVDEFKPVIKVVLPKQLLSLCILLDLFLRFFLGSMIKMILEYDSLSLGLCLSLLVELHEVLGMLNDLIDELFVSGFLSCLEATPHILLKSI